MAGTRITVDGEALRGWERMALGWGSIGPALTDQIVDAAHGPGVVEVRHPEGVLLGEAEVADGDGRATVTRLAVHAPGVHYDHQDLRLEAPEGEVDPGTLVLPLAGVPAAAIIPWIVERARQQGTGVLLLTLGGSRGPGDVEIQTIIRAHRLLAEDLAQQGVAVTHLLTPLDLTDDLAHAAGLVDGHLADASPHGAHRPPADALAAGDAAPAVHDLLERRVPTGDRRGVTVLFTGLSGSGKSTVAGALVALLHATTDRRVTLLDGDLVRTHLSSELGFSREHRDLNVARIGFVAAEVTKHGGVAVAAPIAPYAATRLRVRQMVEAVGEFALVHVATPLEVCEARDRKGLYAMARRGEIAEFTGISDPYEEPDDADVVVDTTDLSPAQAAQQVMALLAERQLI